MKKSGKKVKAVKRSSKSSAPETEMPDLVAVMLKLTERLEAVERKMDLVVSQTANRQNFQQNQPRPQHHQPQHNHNQNQFSQPRPQQQFNQPRSEQNFNRAPQQQQHSQSQNQNRQGGKPMFQAVCADCKKNCEVPFRPSADRATYCKECYSQRKNSGKPSQQQHSGNNSGFPVMEKRQLKVVSNGVGKTVISEMVPVAAGKSAAVSKKSSKPAKKGKK